MTKVNADTLETHLKEAEQREERRYWVFLVYLIVLIAFFFSSHRDIKDPRTQVAFWGLGASICITIGRKIERYWIRQWMARGNDVDDRELLN